MGTIVPINIPSGEKPCLTITENKRAKWPFNISVECNKLSEVKVRLPSVLPAFNLLMALFTLLGLNIRTLLLVFESLHELLIELFISSKSLFNSSLLYETLLNKVSNLSLNNLEILWGSY